MIALRPPAVHSQVSTVSVWCPGKAGMKMAGHATRGPEREHAPKAAGKDKDIFTSDLEEDSCSATIYEQATSQATVPRPFTMCVDLSPSFLHA